MNTSGRRSDWGEALAAYLADGPRPRRDALAEIARHVPPSVAIRRHAQRRAAAGVTSPRSDASPWIAGANAVAQQTLANWVRNGRVVRLPDDRLELVR